MKKISAFSSIEMAITILIIIAIVSAIVFLFNPAKKISESRNKTRTEDVTEIINALSQYADANSGALPAGIPVGDDCTRTEYEICKTGAANCTDKVMLNELTATAEYLTAIPVDPKNTSASGTGYNIVQNESGRVTVCAPSAELGVDISSSK